MSRLTQAADTTAAPTPGAAVALPAAYTPKVAGYAGGPMLLPVTVTPTDWVWRNSRTYIVLDEDGLTYRAVRVTDTHSQRFVGYWAVELLGSPLLPDDWKN